MSISCWALRRVASSLARPWPHRLNAGFVPVRKPGKLPAETVTIKYDLEYGFRTRCRSTRTRSSPASGVIIVDDLLATGGTMLATTQLVKQLGGEIVGLTVAIELDFLKGRAKFPDIDVFSLMHYDE